jgi:GNAT superfamily N-acetyltransferase
MNPAWRPLTEADLVAAKRIAERVYVGLGERLEVFAEKRRLYPPGCLALARGDEVAGYVLSHPWRIGDAPALDALLGALPDSPNCLYLHDIAISAEARGSGAAAAAIARLTELAATERLAAMALISVQGAQKFWRRAGFLTTAAPGLVAKLASYGSGAGYMTKRLAASVTQG